MSDQTFPIFITSTPLVSAGEDMLMLVDSHVFMSDQKDILDSYNLICAVQGISDQDLTCLLKICEMDEKTDKISQWDKIPGVKISWLADQIEQLHDWEVTVWFRASQSAWRQIVAQGQINPMSHKTTSK